MNDECIIDGCAYPVKVKSRGYCSGHYSRWQRGKDLNTPLKDMGNLEKWKSCKADGCYRKRIGQGYCHGHYFRLRNGLDLYNPPLRRRVLHAKCTVEGCERKHENHGYCNTHWGRVQRGSDVNAPIQIKNGPGEWTRWYENNHGYIHRSRKIDGKSEKQLQHRFVMEEYIGRPLLKSENIHHKNGVKDDNRIENLEIWNTSQPAGQRPEDKLAYAYEIIELYGEDSKVWGRQNVLLDEEEK